MALPWQNERDAGALAGEANIAYFFHDRLSPVLEQIKGVDSFHELRANFVSGELLESFLWLHLGTRVGYFPVPLARRTVYEHFHVLLRAYERIIEARLMETWFTPPHQDVWESEFTGRQELFSFGWRPSDPDFSRFLSSVFQVMFVLANGFAQDAKARQLSQSIVMATDLDWNQAIDANRPVSKLEPVEMEPSSHGSFEHWAFPGFFAFLDYMRAFRRANDDAKETARGPRFEVGRYLDLLKEVQQWRVNFGYTTNRLRFLEVARMVAESFVRQELKEEAYNVETVWEDFRRELYELMTDWGAPQAATA